MKSLKVKQDENNPIPTEILANDIRVISDGIKKLRSGSLNERALVLLIQHATPTTVYNGRPTATQVKAILEGIESLEKTYLKKKP